jgi:subtilisin family serine protease
MNQKPLLSTARIALTAVSSLAFALTACQDPNGPDKSELTTARVMPTAPSAAKNAIADEYIVVFKDNVDDVDGRAKGLANAHGGNVKATYRTALKGFSAHMSAAAAAALANEPDVASVEQDQVFEVASTQTGASWGLDRIDQATLPLDGSFTYPTTGAGVNVYIIDSGIRHTHVEFGGRVVPAYSSIADGYGADGCHWHGTHVAGIVGGTTYGVAKGATLYSVRAFDCSGLGTSTSIISAIDWVTQNHRTPSVANLSISGDLSSTVNQAVANSINAGVLYVVAAGNNVGASACNYSPASVSAALTVAAIGGQDTQGSYSNGGTCVDLYAPGTQIYSATNVSDTDVALYSGTSQASAFAAGAAALYLQANPSASPAQVHDALVSAATVGVVNGVTGGAPNRLLRVTTSGGSGGTGGTQPPPPPPPGNVAPTAKLSVSCSRLNCTFDGSASTDDAGIASYAWSFGDGATASGSKASHGYSAAGTYTVTLTVTDTGGLSSSITQSVTVKTKGR